MILHKLSHDLYYIELHNLYFTYSICMIIILGHVLEWKSENRPAVWLHIPTFLGGLIPAASEQGFTLHHVKGEEIVMTRWLAEDRPNKLPNYASHQVGVCGELILLP